MLGDDLDAFRAGRLSLAVFGNAGADPIAEVKVAAPMAAAAPRRR